MSQMKDKYLEIYERIEKALKNFGLSEKVTESTLNHADSSNILDEQIK